MGDATAHPINGRVRITRALTEADPDRQVWRAEAAVDIDPAEPIFAGHYPDFPILPGVLIVDCAHRAALATAPEPAGEVAMHSIESMRLLSAVYPGDLLRIELEWQQRELDWRCVAKASTERGAAASVRLSYGKEASS